LKIITVKLSEFSALKQKRHKTNYKSF